MQLPIYQVDAFADRLFAGNPAAVCPLTEWLPDGSLQAIASENNLSETAFFVRDGEGYRLRWFTPQVEVDLCGHATLASAFVVFHYLEPQRQEVTFRTGVGDLVVRREDERLVMDFPARPPLPCQEVPELEAALGREPSQVLESRSYLVVYRAEEDVRAIVPDMAALAAIGHFGVIITAPSSSPDVDFVSRFFAPSKGVPEDPVTGSAHCTLVPYWAERLGCTRLVARQVSARGGTLWCELRGDRVSIAGHVVPYLEGIIYV